MHTQHANRQTGRQARCWQRPPRPSDESVKAATAANSACVRLASPGVSDRLHSHRRRRSEAMSSSSGSGSAGGGQQPAPRPFRIAIPSFTDAAAQQAPRGLSPQALQARATAAAAAAAPRPLPQPPAAAGPLPPRAFAPYRPQGGGAPPRPMMMPPPPPRPVVGARPVVAGGGGAAASSASAVTNGAPRPPLPLRHNPSAGGYMIAVSPRQQGNPVLKHIRNVPYQITEGITPDYVLGASTCCLYISLRYHLLNPEYLIRRVKELRRDYRLRLLLCLVDVEDSAAPLLEVNRMALLEDCTLLLAWSVQEAARYLETFKAYEHKGCESIQERVDADYQARLTAALTSIRSVNKTDAMTLSSNLGSLADVMRAPRKTLVMCPGLGEVKVQRLWETFHTPFLPKPHQSKQQQKEQEGPKKRRKGGGKTADTLRARILAAEGGNNGLGQGVDGDGDGVVVMEEEGAEEEEEEEARWEAVMDEDDGDEGGGGGVGEDMLEYGSGEEEGGGLMLALGGDDDG